MNLFTLVYEDDAVALVCLIAILYIVGTNMASAVARVWGWRAAAVAYVVFVVYAIFRVLPTSASGLAYIAFRGLFASGLTVGVAWMVFSIVVFFMNGVANAERRVVKRPPPPPPKPKRSKEDIEREKREQKKRERRETKEYLRHLSNKTTCEELRLECELLYSEHAEQLRGVLSPERFRGLLDSYLGGQSDPEIVQKRTRMIRKTLNDMAAKSASGVFDSLKALAAHFANLRDEVNGLPYDEDTQEAFITAINEQESRAIEQFLQGSDV